MPFFAALAMTVSILYGEGQIARIYAWPEGRPLALAAAEVCEAIRGEPVQLPLKFEVYRDAPLPTGAFAPELIGTGMVLECK